MFHAFPKLMHSGHSLAHRCREFHVVGPVYRDDSRVGVRAIIFYTQFA